MTITHLVDYYGDFFHVSIRVLCLDIDFPDISITTLIHGECVGNDRGVYFGRIDDLYGLSYSYL